MAEHERPEAEEGFGQASLGEAQSDDPALDPEMLEHEHEGDEQNVGDADEQLGIDPDAEEEPDADEAAPDDELA